LSGTGPTRVAPELRAGGRAHRGPAARGHGPVRAAGPRERLLSAAISCA
jgi:hypothetical protein